MIRPEHLPAYAGVVIGAKQDRRVADSRKTGVRPGSRKGPEMSEGSPGGGEIQVRPAGQGTVAGPATGDYNPWMRWRVYTSFIMGVSAATLLLVCIAPQAVVLGWMALGMGLPAWLIGRKEVAEFPQAAGHAFVKWGIRTGVLSTFLGPLAAIVWIAIIAAVGVRFF